MRQTVTKIFKVRKVLKLKHSTYDGVLKVKCLSSK